MRDIITCKNCHGICESYTVVTAEGRISCTDVSVLDEQIERIGIEIMIGIRCFACHHVHMALKDDRFAVLISFCSRLIDDDIAYMVLYILKAVLLGKFNTEIADLLISECPPRDH